jgi:hypothetical protein
VATKRDLIAAALEELGMAEYIFDATPEELQSFLRRLDAIAAEWDGQRVRVGYNFGTDITAQAGIPDTARDCFSLHLAIRMAPSFGKAVSGDTRVAAAQAFNAMLVARRVMPEVQLPAGMPVGTGTKRGVMEPQYFQPSSDVPGLNDGATEY